MLVLHGRNTCFPLVCILRLPSKICVQYTHIAVKYREKAVCAEVSETCLDSPNSLYVRPLFSLPCLKPAHISLPCICFHYWPRPPSLHSLGWQPESVEQGAYVYTICFSIKEKTCSLLLLIGAANDPIQHLSPASQHKNLYLVLCGEYTYTFRRTKKKKSWSEIGIVNNNNIYPPKKT